MQRWAVREREQKQQRSQNGLQDSQSGGDYQSYVRQLLKSPSVAEAPPPPPAAAPNVYSNPTPTPTPTPFRPMEWSNRTSDDYHAHVSRMLRTTSIVDAPPYPKVHALFKNDQGHLN